MSSTDPSQTDYEYEVHLVSKITGDDLTSPVTSSHLHYYESGVWVTRDRGRDFFPYEHVRVIRERPVDGEATPPNADG